MNFLVLFVRKRKRQEPVVRPISHNKIKSYAIYPSPPLKNLNYCHLLLNARFLIPIPFNWKGAVFYPFSHLIWKAILYTVRCRPYITYTLLNTDQGTNTTTYCTNTTHKTTYADRSLLTVWITKSTVYQNFKNTYFRHFILNYPLSSYIA
jgi:hypothetical protein